MGGHQHKVRERACYTRTRLAVDTSFRWESCRRAVPANGISRLQRQHAQTRVPRSAKRHATAVHTQGQMPGLRTEC